MRFTTDVGFFSIIKYGNSCKKSLIYDQTFICFVLKIFYWNLKQLAFCDLLNKPHCIYIWQLLLIGYNHCSISFLCVSDSPQTPMNFTGYSFTNNFVNLTWISGFNGDNDQFFTVYLKDGSTWRELGNVTDQRVEKCNLTMGHWPREENTGFGWGVVTQLTARQSLLMLERLLKVNFYFLLKVFKENNFLFVQPV